MLFLRAHHQQGREGATTTFQRRIWRSSRAIVCFARQAGHSDGSVELRGGLPLTCAVFTEFRGEAVSYALLLPLV